MISLKDAHPDIESQWNYKRNAEKHNKDTKHPPTPDKVTYGSDKKVWWICLQGHEWQAAIYSRTGKRKNGCPDCARQKPRREYVNDENRLSIQRPDIAAQWDFERNAEAHTKNPKHPLKPSKVAVNSQKKVWWICRQGPDHQWEAAPASLARSGKGCPYCDGKKLSITNSLATMTFWENSTDLSKIEATWRFLIEWDYPRNFPMRPEEVTFHANKTASWRCIEYGHRWKANVNQRTNAANSYPGCPYCAGKKVSHENALLIRCPDLAEEWDYERNAEEHTKNSKHPLKPSEVTVNSNKKVWWKCLKELSHSWKATPNERNGLNRKGTGCPHCHQAATSFTETLIRCELMQFFPDISHDDRKVFVNQDRPMDVDVKIPSENLIIEYDGYYYHKVLHDREPHDRQKTDKLKKLGWRVVRIREEGLNLIQSHDLTVDHLSGRVYEADYKKLVNDTLIHIQDFLQKEIPGLDEYINRSALTKWKEASEIIQKSTPPEAVSSDDTRQLSLINWEDSSDTP